MGNNEELYIYSSETGVNRCTTTLLVIIFYGVKPLEISKMSIDYTAGWLQFREKSLIRRKAILWLDWMITTML